ALALAQGMPSSVNMIMLGFVLPLLDISLDEARGVIEAISPKRGLNDNLRAIAIGYAQMQQHDAQGGT
ncbi:MAG TPA: hypothetical protein PLB81_00530, partial [Deltaproteobacteria bacterium]|nr:hypothetical protein [Deltaproteobacteria bacterium]